MLHRLVLGALVKLPPLDEPQTASTAVTQLPPPDCDQTPWLQEKPWLPVVGKPLSVAVRDPVCATVLTLAEQLEAP